MKHTENLILGAGFAGLGAAYKLRELGQKVLVVEQEESYGGLSGNFEINGFRFDRFIHLACTINEQVNKIYQASCGEEVIRHNPNPYNIYKRNWIKHPVQNNLYPLDQEEKDIIIRDFERRPDIANVSPDNYEEWLRASFGDYFAEHFPMVYTRKYWRHEARELRTEWIGKRIYQPSINEVIEGSNNPPKETSYYVGNMRYPKSGGYKTFVKCIVDSVDILYSYKVVKIDAANKCVYFANGEIIQYNHIYSSIPLPEYADLITEIPQEIHESISLLEYTSGYHVSIALKTQNIPPYLWWYIYDEDILASRVYSPSLKSPDNVPEGCSSLQMEVYCKENEYTQKELYDGTVGKLIELGIINQDDILFTHFGFEKYANVTFTEPVYRARKIVRDWLKSLGINTIGRFGEWEYLWSDQSLMSGISSVK